MASLPFRLLFLPLILLHFSLKICYLVATILMIFLRINCPKFIGFVWRRHTKFQIGMAAVLSAISLLAPLDDVRWTSEISHLEQEHPEIAIWSGSEVRIRMTSKVQWELRCIELHLW